MTLSYAGYIVIMYFNPYLSKKADEISLFKQQHVEPDKTALIPERADSEEGYGATVESSFSKRIENGVVDTNGLTASNKSDRKCTPS